MKTSALTKLAAVLLTSLAIWAGASIVSLQQRVSTVEAQSTASHTRQDDIIDRLKRIEEKLDGFLLRR